MLFTMQTFLLLLLPFILILFFIKPLLFSTKPHNKLPPSPPKLPLIGNLHQLGSSPHRALWAMAQAHGPLMLIHLGTVPILVASSADVAREIMKTHDLIFSNRPKLNIPSILSYNSKNIGFSQYGEYWRQVKSIVILNLFTKQRVQSYRRVREEEVAIFVKKIHESGSVVNLSELLISVTNNVVCRVALGRCYEGREFKELLDRFIRLLGSFSVGSYIPAMSWVDWLSGLEGRANDVAKEFDEFFEGVIEEHEKKEMGGVEDQDFVDILLEIQKDDTSGFRLERDSIKAIILDVFAAGTDTTFVNIEWAITELLKNPQTLTKLKQETLETGQGRPTITEDDLPKMPYLKAVLKETLRLHTPIPLLVPRESTQAVNLLGYNIPCGTQVLVNAWAVARDLSKWAEPNEFKPERFLNSPVDYKGFHFELIPFGAGRRGCPGIGFAMAVNELVLANLVYKFELALPSEECLDMSESSGLTVHKKCPLLVVATPVF